jgi:hypothetical protein
MASAIAATASGGIARLIVDISNAIEGAEFSVAHRRPSSVDLRVSDRFETLFSMDTLIRQAGPSRSRSALVGFCKAGICAMSSQFPWRPSLPLLKNVMKRGRVAPRGIVPCDDCASEVRRAIRDRN